MSPFYCLHLTNDQRLSPRAASGLVTCTRRSRSNTPLQALTLLNDEAFYEFAQGLATRILREGPEEDRARIEYAFRLCLARRPTTAESSRLGQYLAWEREDLAHKPGEARSLLALEPGVEDVPELAAWTLLSSLLLNLDEMITRE